MWEEQLEAAIEAGGQSVPSLDEIQGIIDVLPGSFPPKCEGRISYLASYRNYLNSMATKCATMQGAYQNIQQGCASLSISLGSCRTEKLYTYATIFDSYCDELEDACDDIEDEEERNACIQEAKDFSSNNDFYDGNISYNANEIPSEANVAFKSEDGKHLNPDYFPGVDWQHSLWVDEDAGN